VDSARTVNNRHTSYVNRHTSYVNNRHSSSYTTVTANVLVTATSCDMHDVMFLSVRCVNSALPQHARVGKACVVTLLCATHALSPAQACSTLAVRLSRLAASVGLFAHPPLSPDVYQFLQTQTQQGGDYFLERGDRTRVGSLQLVAPALVAPLPLPCAPQAWQKAGSRR
jgi:hypothetical protein